MQLYDLKHKSIFSASLVLAITFGISAILGLLRSKFLYARFFSCCVLDLDAYNAAFRIPDLIFKLLVSGALSASFIPVFASSLHKDDKQAYKMASTVINLLMLAFTILSIIAFIFANPISHLIAGGFNAHQIDLMTSLTRILLLAQIFFLLSNFLTGILQVNQIFLIPALSPIVYNVFIILGIFTLAPKFGIYGVVIAAVVGAFFHLAIQIPSVIHTGFKYSFSFDTEISGVREIIRLMIPRSLSLGFDEIDNTVILFFASTLAAGSISILNLALQFMYLPSRIFATTVGQASLPILSKNVAQNELEIFRDTVKKTIFQSLFLAIPVSALILVSRLSIIRLAYGAKQFPWSATLLTSRTLAYMVPSIACQAVMQILIRAFYALHNTRTPLKISILSLISDFIFCFIFVRFTHLGVVGLALAASIGDVLATVALIYYFVRQVDGFNWSELLIKIFKIFLASIALSLATWGSIRFLDYSVLDTSKTFDVALLFIVTSLFGAVIYYLVCLLLRVDELEDYHRIINRLLKRFHRQQISS